MKLVISTTKLGATAVLASALALSACGVSQPQASATKHTLDQPTRGLDGWMWEATPDEDYHQIMMPLLGMSTAQFAESDHELTKRTQFWLDQLDSFIRQNNPEQMVGVPKPQAKVKIDPSMNAFVAPVPVCYDVSINLGGFGQTAGAAYMDTGSGDLSMWPPAVYGCREGTNGDEKIRQFIAQLNAGPSACEYEINETSTGLELTPNAACGTDPDLQGYSGASRLVIMQTANYVTIHTGLVTSSTEESFIAVLAHELGHYYRSHINARDDLYDYYYTMGEENHAHKPVAEANLQRLGDAAKMGATILNASDAYARLENQNFRSELYFGIGSFVTSVCRGGDCSTNCDKAATFINAPEYSQAMASFPFGASVSRDGKEAYQEFETLAAACLADYKIDARSTALDEDTVGWETVLSHVANPAWPSWLGRLSPRGQRFLRQQNMLTMLRVQQPAPAAQTGLDAAISTASDAIEAHDAMATDALKTAYEQRVGQYTIEQEADDIAAEFLTDMGLSADHTVDAMRRLGRGMPDGMRGYLFGSDTCERLASNNWRDAQGNYVFVPVGDYSEIHHSQCYRMFNLEREIKAHAYQPADVEVPTPAGPNWDALKVIARDLSPSPFGGEGQTDALPVASRFAKKALAECAYTPVMEFK